MKILVVDDEQDICEILQYNLENEGFEVVTAYSAEEALELPLQDFSLILLDVMMGELLSFFLQHPNTVFSREDLLKYCWPQDALVLDRTVDVNITRLRKKIGHYGKQIKTRVGYGYCFEK